MKTQVLISTIDFAHSLFFAKFVGKLDIAPVSFLYIGLMPNAAYAERVSLETQKISPLADVHEDAAPYFSMILIYKGAEKWVLDLKTRTTK